jgi:hypothetical protein
MTGLFEIKRRIEVMNHKPNGNAEAAKKAKGCFGRLVYTNKTAKPYKAFSDAMSPRTPSMKDIYNGAKVNHSDPARKRAARKLRQKLAGRG